MKLLGLGKVSDVKPLNEDIAVDLAAEMLGEMIIFSIAAGMLLLEYKRQVWKDMSKEDVQNKRLKSLETEICNLNCRMDEQSKKMREMGRALGIKFEDETQKNTDSDVPTKIVDMKSNTVLNVAKTWHLFWIWISILLIFSYYLVNSVINLYTTVYHSHILNWFRDKWGKIVCRTGYQLLSYGASKQTLSLSFLKSR